MPVPRLLATAVVALTLATAATGCGLDTSEGVVRTAVDAARDGAVPGVATDGATAARTTPGGDASGTDRVGPIATGATPAGASSSTTDTPSVGASPTTTDSPTASASPTTTDSPTAAPADGAAPAAPERLHAPDVVGLRASAAPLRLGASGFRTEYGRRYDVVREAGRTAVLRAGHRADRRVTAQTPARPAAVRPGDVVATATTRTPVPAGRRPRLITVRWGTLRLRGGTLEIGGLGRMADCDRLDHVQLGPRGGASRTVRVWVIAPPDEPRAGCTRRQPRVLRLRPGAGWDRDAVAVDVAADRR